jgi:hypothetical protein
VYSTLNRCSVVDSWYGGWGAVYGCELNHCIVRNGQRGPSFSTLNNCLLTANDNYACYGGVLNNCAVVGNTNGLYDSKANNCIVYYNDLSGGVNFTDDGELGPLVMRNCCTTPDPGGVGNFTNAPLFVDFATGNLRLQAGSPCINSGNNQFVARNTDLDGNPRIAGGTVDVGAYEVQSPTSILSYAWAQQFGIPVDGSADYADTDGDGMNSYSEWIAGTIPTNAASMLNLISVSNSPPGLMVTWQSVDTRTYFLQRSASLSGQPAFSSIRSNLVGQSGTTTFIDNTATNSARYFYRVGIQ